MDNKNTELPTIKETLKKNNSVNTGWINSKKLYLIKKNRLIKK